MLMLLSAVCVLATSASERAGAQVSYSLRYAPRAPIRIHTISRSDILMTVTQEPGGGDPLSVEASRLEGMTQFFDAQAGDRYLVELHYDSLRARLRPVGGTWRDVTAEAGELGVVRAVLTDRLEVLEAEFVDMPHLQATNGQMARCLGGGHLLTLPEIPIAVGASWAADLSYPLNAFAAIGREDGVPAGGELRSEATATLDSVVTRPADTLYYVTARGNFMSAVLPASAGGESVSVTAGGSLAAMMVWSSAWSAFVSGATRAVILMDIRSDPTEGNAVTHVRFDVTTLSQVRM
jgi:hypothetical protein